MQEAEPFTTPPYGIDFGLLSRPLHIYRRGRITTAELCDIAVGVHYTPGCSGGAADLVDNAADLHRRLLASEAFDWAEADDRQQNAACVVVAVLFGIHRLPTRHPDIDTTVLTDIRSHWAAQLVQFIRASPPELRPDRVGMVAARGLERLLPTGMLVDAVSAEHRFWTDDFDYRQTVGTALVERLVAAGEHAYAVDFAADFGAGAQRLLLDAATVLPAESASWPALMALVGEHPKRIAADTDCTGVLYAAANAAAGGHDAWAHLLLGMSNLDSGPDAGADRHDALLRMQLHALTGLIHHALGDRNDARHHARLSADLGTELAVHNGT